MALNAMRKRLCQVVPAECLCRRENDHVVRLQSRARSNGEQSAAHQPWISIGVLTPRITDPPQGVTVLGKHCMQATPRNNGDFGTGADEVSRPTHRDLRSLRSRPLKFFEPLQSSSTFGATGLERCAFGKWSAVRSTVDIEIVEHDKRNLRVQRSARYLTH